MTKPHKDLVPKKMQAKYGEIVALTDDFCQEHLTDEYAQLCRKLAAKLSRKRPSAGKRTCQKLGGGDPLHHYPRQLFV